MMRKAAAYGTAMVVLATVANLLHAVSHVGQDVMSLEAWQWAYVIGVIFLSPVVAAALLWTPLHLAGVAAPRFDERVLRLRSRLPLPDPRS
jgi:uncharacterized integral membrane protein